MVQMIGESSTRLKMHEVIVFQLGVSAAYALLIIFAKRRPDTLLGIALHWWMDRTVPATRILLFFKPPIEENNPIAEQGLAYRHVLAMSLSAAICSVAVSWPCHSAWSFTLNDKLFPKHSNTCRIALATTGYHRMVIAAIAMFYLAFFGDPRENSSLVPFYASNWTILRPPLLIGIASACVLLAAALRRSAHSSSHGRRNDGGGK